MPAGRPLFARSPLSKRAMLHTSCCYPSSRSMKSGSSQGRGDLGAEWPLLIAMSEGIKRPDGEFLSASGLEGDFGHTQLGGAAPVITNLIAAKPSPDRVCPRLALPRR